MRNLLTFLILLSAFISKAQTLTTPQASAAKPVTWKEGQLIQPLELAMLIKDDKAKKPLIFNIGVVDDLPDTKNFGAAHEISNLDNFKKELQGLSKSTFLVVYCGCCPFDRCPNVRPAFSLLNEMGFTNARLLNLPKNLKTDWIDKGYPIAQKK